MGTAIEDFKNPEFLLVGASDYHAAGLVSDVFALVHDAPRYACPIADAEAIKVLYNTYISLKIIWANHVAAICDVVGADADIVVDALTDATRRIASVAYMRPGMGDGGACHPRDLIALADLERRHDLPQFFASLASLRDAQTRRLGSTIIEWANLAGLPIAVLGRAYKPGVPLEDGSAAVLLLRFLTEEFDADKIWHHDPADETEPDLSVPAVYVHATAHEQYRSLQFPAGSVVVDPWGTLPVDQPGVTYVRPGRR